MEMLSEIDETFSGILELKKDVESLPVYDLDDSETFVLVRYYYKKSNLDLKAGDVVQKVNNAFKGKTEMFTLKVCVCKLAHLDAVKGNSAVIHKPNSHLTLIIIEPKPEPKPEHEHQPKPED